jgi:uracil-DNA glycosylase
MEVKIEESWRSVLKEEFSKEYFKNIVNFIKLDYTNNIKVYPEGKNIFNAFNLTPFDKIKVVIIGQDPYHGDGQAHGLSFSVPKGKKIPPSLINIYKEIQNDIGEVKHSTGNLEGWAKQGVFLLNSILTVRAGQPASHSKIGWEIFTNAVIKTISDKKERVVFLLWGNYAKSKKEIINSSKHLILEAAHPSPLARGAFFGCKHFSKTNDFLISIEYSPIIW